MSIPIASNECSTSYTPQASSHARRPVIFGQLTGIRKAPHDRGFGLRTVIERLREKIKAPVITGLPFGHVPTKVLLPVGATVDMAFDGRDVYMVWGHLHAAGH